MRNIARAVMAIVIVTSFLLFLHPDLQADEEPIRHPYVIAADGGRFYFKMVPDFQHPYSDGKGFGILFKVSQQDTDEILWRTNGWFAHKVYISSDGQSLVRIEDWPGKFSKDNVGIAFYRRGELIKSYSPEDLVKDKAAIRNTVSHYFWLNKIGGFSPDTRYRFFTIITVDNIEYGFDIINGTIVYQNRTE